MSRTIRYYDCNAALFVEGTVGVDMSELHERFLAHVPIGGLILDAGCGSGRDSKAFVDRGYRVCAFDASAKIAEAAAGVLGQSVAVRRFEDVTEQPCYDGVWACASLLHVPDGDMAGAIARLWASLKPGGVFCLSFKYGEGERTDGERHFTDATEARLRGWLFRTVAGNRSVPPLECVADAAHPSSRPTAVPAGLWRKRVYCLSCKYHYAVTDTDPDMDVQPQGCVTAPYRRHRPADSPLYWVVQNHLETFLSRGRDVWWEAKVPPHAERELRRFLECGILAHGFARARCDACGHDFLIAFSCKGRAVCPSCNNRRMAETAAHLADHVLPRVPVRQGRCCPYPSGYAIVSSMTAKPSTVPCAFFWMRSTTTCAAAWVPVPRHAPGPWPSSTGSVPR